MREASHHIGATTAASLAAVVSLGLSACQPGPTAGAPKVSVTKLAA